MPKPRAVLYEKMALNPYEVFDMIILSKDECVKWAAGHKLKLSEQAKPLRCNGLSSRLWAPFPKEFPQLLWVARQLESSLVIESECLVWISGWSIFPSSENLQLFYRYRQSYGSNKLIGEAPGHLCLTYERAEIATLIWLGMLHGWDVHVLPDLPYSAVFISHDQYYEIGYSDVNSCLTAQKEFAEAKLELQVKNEA